MSKKTLWIAVCLLVLAVMPGLANVQISLSTNRLSCRAWQGLNSSNTYLFMSQAGGGIDPVDFTASSDVSWVTPQPASGYFSPQAPQTAITLSFQTTSLSTGTYTGRITIGSSVATNVPLVCTVRVDVLPSRRVYGIEPRTQVVSVVNGSTTHVERTLAVWNAATPGQAETLSWMLMPAAEWLQAPQPTGSSSGTQVVHQLVLTNLHVKPIGVYTGRVDIYDAGMPASNSPASATVILNITETPPAVTLSTNRISLIITQGMWLAETHLQVLALTDGSVYFNITNYTPWMTLSANKNWTHIEEPANLTCQFNVQGLAPGTYSDSILADPVGSQSDDDDGQASVVLQVKPYPYSLAVTGNLSGTTQIGGSSVTQTLTVWNAGANVAMPYTAQAGMSPGGPQWLSVTPTAHTCSHYRAQHQVVMNPAGLAEGTHEGWISIMAHDAPNGMVNTSVFFNVGAKMLVSPSPIRCNAPEGGTPSNVSINIWNAGSTNRIYYTLSVDSFWMQCDSTGGDSAGETNLVTLSFDATGLHPGAYRGALHLEATGQILDVPVLFQIGTVLGEFEERLVFSARLDGRPDSDIWSIRPDGTDRRLLYGKSGDQINPRISFDGTRLVFEQPAASCSIIYDLISGAEILVETFDALYWLSGSNDLIQARLVMGAGGYLTRWTLDDMMQNLFHAPGDMFAIVATEPTGERLFFERGPVGGGAGSLRCLRLDTLEQETIQPQSAGWRFQGDLAPGDAALCFTYKAPTGNQRTSLRELTANNSETVLAEAADEQFSGAAYSPDAARVLTRGTRDADGAQRLVSVNRSSKQRTVLFSAPSSASLSPPDCGMLFAVNPRLHLSPAAFTNEVRLLTTGSLTNSLSIRNAGNSVMIWSATSDVEWIYFGAYSGSSTGETDTLRIEIKPYALPDGAYTGLVTITANATNAPQSVQVVLHVNQRPPIIAMESEIETAARLNGSPVVVNVPVWNDGESKFYYSATTNRSWMRLLQWAGWVSNNVSTVRLACYPTGLAAGTYTGQVIVVGDNNRQTNRTTIVFDVFEPQPVPPAPVASPISLHSEPYRYEPTPRQTFTISNSAPAGILSIYITDNANWLSVQPTTTPTNPATFKRRQTFNVWYDTTNLASGMHEAAITIHGSNGTAVVQVAVNVLPPRALALNVQSTSGGGVTWAPRQTNYTYGTPVMLVASNATTHRFKNWEGPTSSARDPRATVILTSNTTVRAVFVERTRIYGYVTNLNNGAGVPGATVYVGLDTTTTDSSGYYECALSSATNLFFMVARKGYTATQTWGVINLVAGGNRRDIGMKPTAISNVRASQPPGTRDVVIWYDLAGETNFRYTISMDISSYKGNSWNVGVTNVSGSLGTLIKPGQNKKIVWKASLDFDNQDCYNALVRLKTHGQSVTSKTFSIITRGADAWKFAAYLDYNGNNQYDPGEIITNAPFYIGQRLYPNITSDGSGIATISKSILEAETIFSRILITSRAAKKSHHGEVDGLMWTLWMDSDVGRDDNSWGGIWKSYRLTSDDVARARRGEVVYIKLGHPIFEWNMTLDVYAPADETFIRNLRAALGRASEYLYRISHGQMKYGKFFISSPDHDLRREDAIVIPNNDEACSTHANDVELDESSADIDMYMCDLDSNYAATNQYSSFGRTIVHEFGHYAFNFRDEYEPLIGKANINTNWGWKNNYPIVFPYNFGTMCYQTVIDSLSSENDYIQNYYDYVPDGYTEFDPPRWNDLANWVPEHYMGRGYRSCWKYLKDKFDHSYNYQGKWIAIRLIGQRPGVFVNGKSTSVDRHGSFTIPRPYNICLVKIDNGSWQTPYSEGGPGRRLDSSTGRLGLFVTDGGNPVAAARVALRQASNGRLIPAGYTDANGHFTLFSWSPGDTLEIFWQGQRLSAMLTDSTPDPRALDFQDSSRRVLPWPLATNRLGLILSGSLASSSNYTLSLRSSLPLAHAPTVLLHFPESASTTATVQSVSVDARSFQFLANLQGEKLGQFEISCTASNGQTLDTLDDYLLIPVSETNSISGAAIEPGLYAQQLETLGLIYKANGPVILPSGTGQPPTNQISSALHFCMLGASLSASNNAGAALRFNLATLRGLDIANASAWQWRAPSWYPHPGHLDLAESTYWVSLTNDAPVALFANSSSDTNPPSAITDLVAFTGDDPFTVRLQWTAPGGDGTNGQAFAYDLRCSPDQTDWSAGLPFDLHLTPASAGSSESAVLTLPKSGILYHFSIRALDTAGNISPSNNSAAAQSALDDTNGDGISDSWFADAEAEAGTNLTAASDLDHDGLTTYDEFLRRTDPNSWDTDGDEMPDGYESDNNLDPLDASDRDEDADGDRLSNHEEAQLGTDAGNPDTDADGMDDKWEMDNHLDPLTSGNLCGGDDDPDDDGFPNDDEYTADTDPLDISRFLQIKTFVPTLDGITLYLDASTQRTFGVEGAADLTTPDPWKTVLAPLPGQGDNTPLHIPATNHVEIFRINAELP